jgi:hypothetical protein
LPPRLGEKYGPDATLTIFQTVSLGSKVNRILGWTGFLYFSRFRDDAKLPHHAEVVCYRPVVLHLSIGDAHDVNEPNRYLLAGWGDAQEFAPMGTVEGLTRCDFVPFGDHVLAGEIGIWEGLAKHGRDLLDTLTIRRHSRWGAVVYEPGGVKLIYDVDVAPALHFVDEATDEGLLSSADMLLSSLHSSVGSHYAPTHDARRHNPTRTSENAHKGSLREFRTSRHCGE